MSTSPRLAYRADIDGIRAVAVLLVVVFHFRLVSDVHSGFVGVDVFFVISGFLITSIVQQQLDNRSFRLATFWLHRVRRLAPALVATTALTLLAGWLWLMPSDFLKLAQQTIAAQLYVANIFYWRNVNYFGLQAHDVYLLHTWSLAVEEQFYILFPLMLAGIAWCTRRTSRGARPLLVAALAIAAAVSFGLNLYFVARKPEATFYLMPTRAWELLAGAFLALYLLEPKALRRVIGEAAGVAGLACLLVAVACHREDIDFPGVFALWPVAAGVLLILSGSGGPTITSRLLSAPPLVYLGKLSYPLYLVHWPINVFAAVRWGDGYSWRLRLGMLSLSFALAAAIFHLIEGPVRRWLARKGSSPTLSLYAVAVVAAVGVSVTVVMSQGAPTRFPDDVVRLAAYAQDVPPPLAQCEYAGASALAAASLCHLGVEGAEPQWFIYGDSHAWAASGALDLWLKQTGQSAYFAFVHACPPIRGVYVFRQGDACHAFNAAALSFIEGRASVQRVLLISTWRQATEGALGSVYGTKASASESVALFDRQFAATVQELTTAGKAVYVWEPLPGGRVNVPQAMARAALQGAAGDNDFGHAEYRSEFAFFFSALERQGASLRGTFSPASELCGSGRCITSIDGNPLYFDNAHLAYSTRNYWAAALARQLPGQADSAK